MIVNLHMRRGAIAGIYRERLRDELLAKYGRKADYRKPPYLELHRADLAYVSAMRGDPDALGPAILRLRRAWQALDLPMG